MNLCFLNTISARRCWQWRRWQKRQDTMRLASTRRSIRKLEHLYFLERRGLL